MKAKNTPYASVRE